MHVISTGVILDLVIPNLIIKQLNLFVGLKHVGLGPKEELRHRLGFYQLDRFFLG